MDRAAVYLGQVPRSLDILSQGQNSMVGLAKLSEAVLGTSTVVTGFPITATAPASLNINVGAGQVYEVEPLEATQLSGLAPDAHQIVKQGLTLDPTTLTLVPPTTVGFAVNVLIEVQYADSDTGPLVLTFQNPASPGTTYQGPGGNGQSSNTVRKGVAQIVPKYGTAATAGQQTTPAPDAGYVGVAVVTLSYGQTQVTSTSVSSYNSNASYIPTTLTGVPFGVQSGAWVVGYATPAGTTAGTVPANTYAGSVFSTAAYPFALTAGMELLVYFGTGNTTTSPTLNISGSGALPILRQGGGAPGIANASAGLPPDVQGWMPLILRADKGAWLINGLAYSDVYALISANAPVTLRANRTLYVRTDGSDVTGTGAANTSASAFATIAGALAYAQASFNFAGYSLIIQLGIAGTYAAPYNINGIPNVQILGSNTAQSTYIITGSAAGFLINVSGCSVTLSGVTLNATGTATGWLTCSTGSLSFSYTNFTSGGQTSSQSVISAGVAGIITMGPAIAVSGIAAAAFMSASNGGGVTQTSIPVFSGTNSFSVAFANFVNNSVYQTGVASSYTTTGGAAISCKQYNVTFSASISINGATVSGYFPGGTAGTSSFGGQIG